jgi:hypothetical protein
MVATSGGGNGRSTPVWWMQARAHLLLGVDPVARGNTGPGRGGIRCGIIASDRAPHEGFAAEVPDFNDWQGPTRSISVRYRTIW